MQVARVGWQDVEFGAEIRRYPYTFFSLNQAEQLRYVEFCAEHRKLEERIEESQPSKEASRKRVHGLFLDIIKPFLDVCQLEVGECFAGHGESKEIHVKTRDYTLFKDNDPSGFDILFGVTCWFERIQEANILPCRSSLRYKSKTDKSWLKSGVLDDITKSIIEEGSRQQKGFLMDTKYGGCNFAPTDIAVSVMAVLGKILIKIGSEELKNIEVLYTEFERNIGTTSRSERIFREAYKQRLNDALTAAGLFSNQPILN